MKIRSFTSAPGPLTEFVELPWALRRADPGWVPPLKASVRAQLGPGNPFFRHGRARHFLAMEGGTPVGRCSAIVDDRLTVGGGRVGTVGYFEVELEYDTAARLLDEALGWLDQEDVQVVWGPVDFSIFNAYRFKVSGFERAPFLGEPNNPPAYPEYFGRYGFDVLETFSVWDLDEEQVLQLLRRAEQGARRKGTAERGYTHRPLDVSRLDQDVRALYEVAEECFSGHTGFVPISPEEFAFWNLGPPALLDPELILLSLAPDGEVVGASYTYPDWAPLMKRLDGELDPGTLPEARAGVRVDRTIYHTEMVRPEHRGHGLIHGMFEEFIPVAISKGYTRAVTGLANRERVDWSGYLGGRPPTRQYALYRFEL